MDGRPLTYFVSDVHLGLEVNDPVNREARFVAFLDSIPADRTATLYMLGDIWDFWYEYKDVVPKGYVDVFASLMRLKKAGVELVFFPGNHDIWCYHYFESLGIKVQKEPLFINISGKTFCLAHGDGLGPGMCAYKLMSALFHNRAAQALFSALHPRVAFALARRTSHGSRLAHDIHYVWKGEQEPLYQWALEQCRDRKVDEFVFGHMHVPVREILPGGACLNVLGDWMEGDYFLYFDGIGVGSGHSMKTE